MTATAALRRLWHREEGVAVVEFALTLPLLIGLSLTGFEVSSYAMLNIKLQHAATSMAQLATMEEELPATVLDGMFESVSHIVKPFTFGNQGRAFVTGIGEAAAGAGPTVNWQRSGAGSLPTSSAVGAPGGGASVPKELTISPTQALVAAEVVYNYQPILLGFIPTTTVRKVAYFRPRFGTLPSLS
ncbi:MAG: pilus assembly protein [Rhodospirillales bacterium]|jgi:hypothetical protein|nr:pilus assembly protein [Rhodospirillales bacterium]